MEKTSIVYDEITHFDVVDAASVRVYFKRGSCHVMRPSPVLKVGNTIGIDTHGRVWSKD